MLAGAAAVSLIVSAAATAHAATAIDVGALRLVSHAPSFVAQERGYFAEEGLDVTFRFFEAAQPMAVAIASGDVDYGVTAISGGLVSLAEKGAIKVIGGALQEEKGIDGQMVLASDEAFAAGLDHPSKLGGHTFGMTTAGSSFHYMAAKIAQAEGLDDLELKPLQQVGAIIGALKSNQIDAWAIVPHIAKALVASGAAHEIGRIADYLPDYQVTTIFTSAENAADERETTVAFLRAFAKGAADFNAALVDRTAGEKAADEMVALIHGYVYSDKPLEEAAPSIRNGAMRSNEGAALNLTSVRDQLDWFKAEGLVKPGITIETLVDDTYVEIR